MINLNYFKSFLSIFNQISKFINISKVIKSIDFKLLHPLILVVIAVLPSYLVVDQSNLSKFQYKRLMKNKNRNGKKYELLNLRNIT